MRTRTLILTLVFLASCQGGTQSPAPADAGGEMLTLPADIDESFVPALWGEAEAIEVKFDWKSDNRPGDDDGTCVRIAYRPVDEYWAAILRWDCVGGRNAGGLTILLDDLRIEPPGREHSDRGESLPAP